MRAMVGRACQLENPGCGLFCCALTLLLIVGGFPRGTQADSAARIVDLWQARQERVKNVRFRLSGESLFPRNSLTYLKDLMDHPPAGDVPPQDVTHKRSALLVIDLEANRVRREWETDLFSLTEGKFVPDVRSWVYDGSQAYEIWPKERMIAAGRKVSPGQPDVAVSAGRREPFFFHYTEYPVCWGIGLMQSLELRALRSVLPVEIYSEAGKGMVGERECVILRTKTQPGTARDFGEIWVDVERDGAVLKYIFFANGKESTIYDIEYQYAEQEWLPKSWKLIKYAPLDGGRSALSEQHRMRVEEFSLNVPIAPDTFDVPQKPGMIVADKAGGKTFRKGKAGEPDVLLSTSRRPVPIVPSSRPYLWVLMLGTGLIVPIGLFLVLMARRRRRGL